MIFVRKDVVADIVKRTEQLSETTGVKAARGLPGFEAFETSLRNQKPVRSEIDSDRPSSLQTGLPQAIVR